VISLDADLERILQDAMQMKEQTSTGKKAGMADKVHQVLRETLEMSGTIPVRVVAMVVAGIPA